MAKNDTPEVPRRCDRCSYQWWALTPPRPARKLRWYDDASRMTGSAAARSIRIAQNAASHNAVAARLEELFGMCARCGSHSVSTVAEKGFVPTGLQVAEGGVEQPATQGGVEQPAPASVPGSSPAVTQEGPPGDPFPIGTRVQINVLGARGTTGTIEGRTKYGYKVRLDSGKIVKNLMAKRLLPE